MLQAEYLADCPRTADAADAVRVVAETADPEMLVVGARVMARMEGDLAAAMRVAGNLALLSYASGIGIGTKTMRDYEELKRRVASPEPERECGATSPDGQRACDLVRGHRSWHACQLSGEQWPRSVAERRARAASATEPPMVEADQWGEWVEYEVDNYHERRQRVRFRKGGA